METRNDFSKGSVSGNILKLAVPMTVAQLVNVLYSVVDRVYIGHLPNASTEALTGIGLSLPVITMISAFSNLFGMGGAPLCSIARGAGEVKKAEKIMGNSFTLLLVSGMILMAFCYMTMRPMLFLFGASSQTFPYAKAYLSVYLVGTLFMMISLGMNNFINAQGFGKMGMMTVLIGAVLNIVLDPVFILVFGMGVYGAAAATVISQGVSSIYVLWFLRGNHVLFRLKREDMILDKKLVREITALGLSGFVMSVTNSSVQIVCNAMLSRFGGDLYVGVMTVINSVREIITMPVNGLTNGAQPVIGFNYGAGEFERVKKAIRFMGISCVAFTCAVWAVLFTVPQFFIHLFNSEPELLETGVGAFRIYFFGIFLMALQFTGQSTFVALGKSRQAVFFSLLRKAFIVIPLTIGLPLIGGLGVDGVFLAEPVSNLIGGTACFVTMYVTVYRRLGKK